MISASAHMLLLSMFLVKAVFFATDMDNFEAAVRVDIVDLPDKITNQTASPEPPKIEPTPPAPEEKKVEAPPAPEPVQIPVKSEPKKPEAIDLKKTKAQQKDALNKLKSLSAIEKIKEEMKKKPSDTKSTTQFKGNMISPGTELRGVNKLQHESYRGEVYRKAKESWLLPEWLARTQLQALVLVKIDERGFVVYKRITKSSGNPAYDEAVLEAINRASPFPAPPSKFKDMLAIDGVTIEFVPDK